ncbi:MAG: cytochrome c [Gammaproteobacteria bacterium]|nr:cytochrome c [Gammaproteobacteria bacterium]
MTRHVLLLSLIVIFPYSTASFADNEDTIKYRQHLMNILSLNLKSSSLILKGKIKADIAGHNAAILDSSYKLSSLFPEGSDFGDTDAKEAVWTQNEKFNSELLKFNNSAIAFNKEPSMQTFSDVTKSCKSCHKAFREK